MQVSLELSIIIPVLNQRHKIETCVNSIYVQTFPKELFEIIVIDNGSTDGTWEFIRRQPVRSFQINDIRSPYLCRNKGVDLSKGKYILFLDSNLTISNFEWLEKAMKRVLQERVISVTKIMPIHKHLSVSQWCEIIAFFRYNKLASQNKGAIIGNLFISKKDFFHLGYFDLDRHGSETRWIKQALIKNYRVQLISDLSVNYSPKDWQAYKKKMARVGIGSKYIVKKGNKYLFTGVIQILAGMRPPNLFKVYSLLKFESMHVHSIAWYIRIFFAMWYFRIYQRSITLGLINAESD